MMKHENEIEVYCVKYALTQGIFKVRGAEDDGRFSCPSRLHQSFGPKEWDHTLEGAKVKAEAMRQKRIASLKKSLEKTETMEIKVV